MSIKFPRKASVKVVAVGLRVMLQLIRLHPCFPRSGLKQTFKYGSLREQFKKSVSRKRNIISIEENKRGCFRKFHSSTDVCSSSKRSNFICVLLKCSSVLSHRVSCHLCLVMDIKRLPLFALNKPPFLKQISITKSK